MKNWMTTWMKEKTAETLVEVVVAVFVVVMGSAVATTLIVNSMRANSFSKDNLVALNLAVEGLEAVRNIRDTNWMKFGFDKTNCWNLVPGSGPGDCSPLYDQIAEGYYTADLNPISYEFDLGSVADSLDLNSASNPNDSYRLGYVDLTTVAGTQDILITEDTIAGLGLTNAGASKFYREIHIEYDTGDPATGEIMYVTSTVQWDQNGVHQVELTTSLANYQKVST
ncbi:MAG TPA: hypothetical protein PKA32_01510 [Candidatus Gracilibacteria bacterium]|nr:hypothetical protein [Candidatus Gracilibacteria bacterium]